MRPNLWQLRAVKVPPQHRETAMSKPIYVSAKDVARFLGVSPESVRTWAMKGRVPALRLPDGRYRFHLAAVERAMSVGSGSERAPRAATGRQFVKARAAEAPAAPPPRPPISVVPAAEPEPERRPPMRKQVPRQMTASDLAATINAIAAR